MRNYDLEAQDSSNGLYEHKIDTFVRERLLERFKGRLVSKAKALEIGSFEGNMTSLLLNYVEDLTVIEPSSELCQTITKNFGERIKVVNTTIESFNTQDRYDAIFLIHTLEHLEDRSVCLEKIGDLLAPGGILFIAVPNANAASRRIAVNMNLILSLQSVTPQEKSFGHTFTYNLDTLRADVKEAQLEILESGGVFFKAFANYQLDMALNLEVISREYLLAADELAKEYPDLSSSIYVCCRRN